MAEIRERVTSAISRAQAELSIALSDLERLPAIDPSSTVFAAHALNNYLTVISGTTELLLTELSRWPNSQIQKWIEGIQHATDLMSRTVSHMVRSSSAEELRLRFEPVDYELLVHRVCNYYRRFANGKSVRIEERLAGTALLIRADRVALAAALDNLMSNAVKYSSPGKSIVVQVVSESESVVCRVRDEGPGLSREDHARLFQRGATLTPKPTAGESTMGYGLAVAKELVERMDGEVWCETALGEGSTFAIRMPVFRSSGSEAG